MKVEKGVVSLSERGLQGIIENAHRAGVKEVVETFDYDVCSMAERFPTISELTDFINKWQAQLKEWGIDETHNIKKNQQ